MTQKSKIVAIKVGEMKTAIPEKAFKFCVQVCFVMLTLYRGICNYFFVDNKLKSKTLRQISGFLEIFHNNIWKPICLFSIQQSFTQFFFVIQVIISGPTKKQGYFLLCTLIFCFVDTLTQVACYQFGFHGVNQWAYQMGVFF